MKTIKYLFLTLAVLFLTACGNTEVVDDSSPLIYVSSPIAHEKVSSPVTISGEARGFWYFEASFPIEIYDENNKLLVSGQAEAQEDWMTTEPVPFEAKLTFDHPKGTEGKIVLHKANPSGLPENDETFEVSIQFETKEEPSTSTHPDLSITSPQANAVVSSPLVVEGEAKGPWFFEASFPVELYDDNDKLLGIGIAQADGEWMTEDFVAFKAEIEFEKPTTTKGKLVFKKDNPSGLPQNADSFELPVIFE